MFRRASQQNETTCGRKWRLRSRTIVETRATALLQEVGIYDYRHPHTRRLLTDFKTIKSAVRKDGGAVLAATNWTVNGSTTEGGKMVREISKLMLRAFNAEADNLVRSLKPFKLNRGMSRVLLNFLKRSALPTLSR
jgi:hypothetical protein